MSEKKFSFVFRLFALALLVSTLISCDNYQPGATEKGALGGAAVGAGLGAIIGNQTGRAGEGVAIGAALGALSGALVGQGIDQQDEQLKQRDQMINQQQQLIDENRRLLNELRSRGADVEITDRGVMINLPDVLFEFGRAELTPAAQATARDISTVLRDYSGRRIAVEGHTDSVGGVAYNQRLSEDRARSVANALNKNGIQRSAMVVRGFGKTDPIATNSTEEGRRRNRRVEVIVENQ